jgi:endonuclease/exonuclease/phosphatase family metal-dependent hydrolase
MNRQKEISGKGRLRTSLGIAVLAAMAVACEDPLTGPEAPEASVAQEFSLDGGGGPLKVMTWNIYVGADLDPLLVTPPEQLPIAVALAFRELLSTRFPERARAIARQIALSRPHLIGLQEVSVIRLQPQSDFLVNPTPNAQLVLFNYLDILLKTLEAWGLHYRVAGINQNADVELPMLVWLNPLLLSDVRLTDFDVVLARADVQIDDVEAGDYNVRLVVPVPHPVVPDFAIDVKRGYVRVDATVHGRTYRFANTHLEPVQLPDDQCPVGPPCPEFFQLAQAAELVTALEANPPAGAPIVVVGDFNSPARTSALPVGGPAYESLLGLGYVDVWTENDLPGQGDGLTNPHDGDLRNETVNFTQRIDLIFANTDPSSVFAWVVGDEQQDRTFPSFLWPSDHAGVIARLTIPPGLLALGNN